eukprot:TRINITY_DN12429_c0_g1_i1.p1 TRINITY_DN12429_c0_g1~~TRINITY_DN12429_c0_g1_i1.p1  ORF type:complete len:604 (-),score=106.21 TRINITY_DN12429_c0_g1_i1:124-1740(-)
MSHHNLEIATCAAWCITNIASGGDEDCHQLLNSKALSVIGYCYNRPDATEALYDQLNWVVGNLAGSPSIVEVMDVEVWVELISRTAKNFVSLNHRQTAMWALSNLVKVSVSSRTFALLTPMIMDMLKVIEGSYASQYSENNVDIFWVLAFITKKEQICRELLRPPFAPILKFLMKGLEQTNAVNYKKRKPALIPLVRVLGNIVCTDLTATFCRQYDLIGAAIKMVSMFSAITQADSEEIAMIKEVLWMLSNITADSQCAPLFAQIPTNLASLLLSFQFRGASQKEAYWCISNLISEHVKYFASALNSSHVVTSFFNVLIAILESEHSMLVAHTVASLSFALPHVCELIDPSLRNSFLEEASQRLDKPLSVLAKQAGPVVASQSAALHKRFCEARLNVASLPLKTPLNASSTAKLNTTGTVFEFGAMEKALDNVPAYPNSLPSLVSNGSQANGAQGGSTQDGSSGTFSMPPIFKLISKKVTGYTLYGYAHRPLLKKAHPSLAVVEITRKLASQWKLASAEEKEAYKASAKSHNIQNGFA